MLLTKNPFLRRTATFLILSGILCFGFWIRHFTLWLPHWQGDQSQYIDLALKYSRSGLLDYNLSGLGIRLRTVNSRPEWKLVYPILLDNKAERGDVLRAYEMQGMMLYDMPLFYKAPFFPATLSFAHRWLTGVDHPWVVVKYNLGWNVFHTKPELFIRSQYWVTAVPLLSSLVLILLTFWIGQRFFGSEVGLISAWAMALNPVSTVASNRILADEYLTVWVTLSLFLFYTSFKKNSYLFTFFAGFLCGLALLTKQNAILMFSVVWGFIFLTSGYKFSDKKAWIAPWVNPHFLLFLGTALFISFDWYWRVYKTYGTPFYHPGYHHMVKNAMNESNAWFVLLEKRPHPFILFTVGIPYMCPPFVFIYASFKDFIKGLKAIWARKIKDPKFLFLWLWVLAFFVFFVTRTESKEHRYLLPAYPAIAVLSGRMLQWARQTLSKKTSNPALVFILMIVFLGWSAWWAVPMAWDAIFNERFLIYRPF